MSISTVDGLLAGFGPQYEFLKSTGTMRAASSMHSCWYNAGIPGAASAPASGLNGETVTNATVGALEYTNAASGQKYLATMRAVSSTIGAAKVLDRLWQNSGLVVTTTTAQAISSPVALPARDQNGASNGAGCMLYIEVVTATTNGGTISNMTASYTNPSGTAGRTATLTSFFSSSNAGTFYRFNLQAGDFGVKSVESVTLGTSLVSGSVSIVIAREIASIGVVTASVENARGFLDLGLPKLYDGTALMIAYYPNASTASIVTGAVTNTEG